MGFSSQSIQESQLQIKLELERNFLCRLSWGGSPIRARQRVKRKDILDPALCTEAATEEVSRNKQPSSRDSRAMLPEKHQRKALGLVIEILKQEHLYKMGIL